MATEVPGVLSTEEAAQELGIARQLVCKYIREGRLKAMIFGDRTYVIPRKALDDFKKVPRKRGNPHSKRK